MREKTLESVRREIAEVDRALVELIARRCHLAQEAGACKARIRRPLVDPRQEASVVRRGAALAREQGLNPEEVRDIFWSLIRLSRGSQIAGRRP